MRKRPISLTIISLLLAWLALAGFANAAAGLMGNRIIPAAYGLTALIAAVALWKKKPWGFTAFITWSVVVILTAWTMQRGQFRIPIAHFAGFISIVILILAAGAIIIRKALNKCVEPAGGAYVSPAAGDPSAHP